MSSSNSSKSNRASSLGAARRSPHRTERLRSTPWFEGDRFDRWRSSRVAVIGGGMLGSRLAPEIVRSGASTWICDFDHAELGNYATQQLRDNVQREKREVGNSKVELIVAHCDEIEPRRARGSIADVRDVGIAPFLDCDLIVDCTDDPNLLWHLTIISNGLNIPLLRLAVDGTGEAQLGRVLTSHGGGGYSCQCCSLRREPLQERPRTPCVTTQSRSEAQQRPPTQANAALALTVVGVGLLQAQRLLIGLEEQALDRQIVIDLDHYGTRAFTLKRSERCTSAHQRWALQTLPYDADNTDFESLVEHLRQQHPTVPSSTITFELFGQPLQLGAACRRGHTELTTRFLPAPSPRCHCGESMKWITEAARSRLTLAQCRELKIHRTPLAQLGATRNGTLVVASVDTASLDAAPLDTHSPSIPSLLRRTFHLLLQPSPGPQKSLNHGPQPQEHA